VAYRVIQWATGSVGRYAIQAIAEREDLELVGVYVTRPEKIGRDAGELAGIGKLGVLASGDVNEIVALEADCVLYAPLHADLDQVCRLLASGKHVITPVQYVNPRACDAHTRARLEQACRDGGSAIHGTGIHPGFIGERLALTLAGLSRSVSQVVVQEVADLRPHPSSAMMFEGLGFGAQPDQVRANPPRVIQTMDSIFEQSQRLVMEALGCQVDRFEHAYDVALARVRLQVRAGVIEPGTVAAQRFEWRSYHGDRALVIYRAFWKMGQGAELDPDWGYGPLKYSVIIEGEPSLRCTLEPGSSFLGPPDPAFDAGAAGRQWTAMACVNAIREVCAAPPGPFAVTELRPSRAAAPLRRARDNRGTRA
jgi:hypothetical protein